MRVFCAVRTGEHRRAQARIEGGTFARSVLYLGSGNPLPNPGAGQRPVCELAEDPPSSIKQLLQTILLFHTTGTDIREQITVEKYHTLSSCRLLQTNFPEAN